MGSSVARPNSIKSASAGNAGTQVVFMDADYSATVLCSD